MAFEKLNKDVLNISALDNKPSCSATELKACFDQAGKDIKNFINGLIDAIAAETAAGNIGANISSVATKTLAGVLSEFEKSIQARYTKTETEVLVSQNTNDLIADFDVNLSTGVITITKKDGTIEIFDTALEKVPATFTLVEENGVYYLKITNVDGTSTQINVNALFNEYIFQNSTEISFATEADENKRMVVASIRDNSIGKAKLTLELISEFEGYVSSASSSATSASASAKNAKDSEEVAISKANEASTSETSARTSAELASTKASEASTSATNANDSAQIALTNANSTKENSISANISAENASASATQAGESATIATNKATEASASAESANVSVSSASASAESAEADARLANVAASLANNKANEASSKATEANTSANNAKSSETIATTKATEAKSYAIGGTGTRENEDIDNAKYYAEQAKVSTPDGHMNSSVTNNPDGVHGIRYYEDKLSVYDPEQQEWAEVVTANSGDEKPYLTFQSDTSFTIEKYTTEPDCMWDGQMEYSADGNKWNIWNGTLVTSALNNGKYKLFFRGKGNTRVGGYRMSGLVNAWELTGANIECIGNIENLLDYRTVSRGEHPVMEDYCYSDIFRGCNALIKAPELSATTLANSCYQSMFYGCTGLTRVPKLPATTLALNCYWGMFRDCTGLTALPALPATSLEDACYDEMFYGCTNIKVSATKTSEYPHEWRIPTTGIGTTATNALTGMLISTGGTFTGTPSINTTYYTNHLPVKDYTTEEIVDIAKDGNSSIYVINPTMASDNYITDSAINRELIDIKNKVLNSEFTKVFFKHDTITNGKIILLTNWNCYDQGGILGGSVSGLYYADDAAYDISLWYDIDAQQFVVSKTEIHKKDTMLKSIYDSNNNGIVDNAEKVNGHTVQSDVPANAKFTDTTYGVATTSTNGLMSASDKTKVNSSVISSTINSIEVVTAYPATETAGVLYIKTGA